MPVRCNTVTKFSVISAIQSNKTMVKFVKFYYLFFPVKRRGLTTIWRNSNESTVTSPFVNTFQNIKNPATSDRSNFAQCNWPLHMLVPKGTPEGFPAELFVMVSDWDSVSI